MRRALLAGVIVGVLCAAPAQASPVLLEQIPAIGSGGSAPYQQGSSLTSFYFLLGYYGAVSWDAVVGFEKNWVGTLSGQFDFNAGNSTGFNGVVARLTDGVTTYIQAWNNPWVNSVSGVTGGPGFFEPALQGASIDFIRLVVTDWSYGFGPASELFPGQLELNYSYSISWEIWGTPSSSVPDPGSSLLLFGIGLVGLRAWRKRRQ